MDRAVDHRQIAGFDQFDAHLLGEQRMFIVGGVVTAGGEDHDRRIREIRQELERAEQAARVFVDRPHVIGFEQFREGPLHDLPSFQYVGDAGGITIIVLEDVEPSVADADEIDPRDVAPDAPGRIQSHADRLESLAGIDQLAGDDAVLENLSIMVDVVEKTIQCADALLKAGLDVAPIRCGDDPRNDVERKVCSCPPSLP